MEGKLRIGVLMGGKSDEHEVSIMSAVSVLKNLDSSKYTLLPIGISRNGFWVNLSEDLSFDPLNVPDETVFKAAVAKADVVSTQRAMFSLTQELDVVFPVLHGPFGEDGAVQGMLEMLDVPYVGAGVTASALCMDKGFAKHILKDHGIPVVPWEEFYSTDYPHDCEALFDAVEKRLEYPVFVKPANLGSSVGISKAKDRMQLQEAVSTAFRYDGKIIVEEGVPCRELECAVLGNDAIRVSCVGEVIPAHEFYDYEAKYFCDGESKIIIPAAIEMETADVIRGYAESAYRILGITGLSRIDFFQDKLNGKIYLNEINTMPGFTKFSMYPLLWAESGIPYGVLLERLIELALEKRRCI